MRKVVVYELLSMDGVAEAPGTWMSGAGGDALIDNLARVIATQDTVLLGRRTYDEWAGYWPTSAMQPFADFINDTPKHVLTSSAPEHGWTASTVVARPAEEHVAELKRGAGGDIGVHGSLSVAGALLRSGLVDELRVVVAPVVVGRGRRLFEDAGTLRRFQLIDVERTPGGALLLGYRAT